MKKILCAMSALLLSALLLAGCGKDGGGQDKTGTDGQDAALSEWKKSGFQVSEKVEEGIELWTDRFIPWEHRELLKDPEKEQLYVLSSYSDVKICDGKIYRLEMIYRSDREGSRTVLEIFDPAVGKSTSKEISAEIIGVELEEGASLYSMDVMDEDHFVFEYVKTERNEEDQFRPIFCKMVYTDLKGNGEAVDLLPVLVEKGLLSEDFSQVNPLLVLADFRCDGRGNIYLAANNRGMGNSDFYVFTRDGKSLTEYQGDISKYVGEPLRTQEGDVIYGIYDREESGYRFCWVDTEAGELRTLCQVKGRQNIQRLLAMQGSDLYYQSPTGIVRWNVETGKRTEVFSLEENAVLKEQNVSMILREGQAPLLRTFQSSKDRSWLIELSDSEVERADAVRVADLGKIINTVGVSTGHQQVAQCATLTMMEDPNVTFAYERASSKDYDTVRDRIFAELAAGNGPDILYVTRDDLEILADKGVLMDLKGMLPSGATEEILSGALELGTVDGKLVGLPANIYADVVMVDCDVWSEDGWSLEDVIGLVEEGKLEPLFYSGGQGYFWPLASMMLIATMDLENSFLIDWENRKCHFDDERFVRMLELANVDVQSLEKDEEHLLKGGKRVAFWSLSRESSIPDFGLEAERENGHYVGFPSGVRRGNCIDTAGLLVVNAATKRPEEVKTFLEVFLGEEVQRQIPNSGLDGIGIKGFSKDWIRYSEDGKPLLRGQELEVFENGETSLDRAQDFLMSCRAASRSYEKLCDIIREELNALYFGGRDVKSTVDILNNRVQLYLNEQD